MNRPTQVESLPPADDDVDAGTPEWDALAERWEQVQAVQAEQVVGADA